MIYILTFFFFFSFEANYYLAPQLVILERIGNKVRDILTETQAQKVDPERQEEVAWRANNVLTACDANLFNLVEKILGGLRDQQIATSKITSAVSKTFVAVKLLAISSASLSALIFDEECKEQVVALTNSTSYQ